MIKSEESFGAPIWLHRFSRLLLYQSDRQMFTFVTITYQSGILFLYLYAGLGCFINLIIKYLIRNIFLDDFKGISIKKSQLSWGLNQGEGAVLSSSTCAKFDTYFTYVDIFLCMFCCDVKDQNCILYYFNVILKNSIVLSW